MEIPTLLLRVWLILAGAWKGGRWEIGQWRAGRRLLVSARALLCLCPSPSQGSWRWRHLRVMAMGGVHRGSEPQAQQHLGKDPCAQGCHSRVAAGFQEDYVGSDYEHYQRSPVWMRGLPQMCHTIKDSRELRRTEANGRRFSYG